jgi:hypothetical protein
MKQGKNMETYENATETETLQKRNETNSSRWTKGNFTNDPMIPPIPIALSKDKVTGSVSS